MTLGNSITEVRIVEAAVRLFARQGYHNTATREIAHIAQVNEATLFRYFPTKTDLFEAAVESRLRGVKLNRELQRCLSSDQPPSLVVPMLVDFLVETFTREPELLRLLSVGALELPRVEQLYREHFGIIFDQVSAYFERCARQGLIGPVDATSATLGMVGTVAAQFTIGGLFGRDWNGMAEQMRNSQSELWLRALGQASSALPPPPEAEAFC